MRASARGHMRAGTNMLGYQTTIARAVALDGIGVHTGESASVTFHPAPPDTGVVFERAMPDGEVVHLKAVASTVGFTDFCTVLGTPMGRAVMTVEHLVAAIYASGIDNLRICDASAFPTPRCSLPPGPTCAIS